MAVGTTTAILLGLGGAAGGFGFSKMINKASNISAPTPLPQPPVAADAAAKGQEVATKRKALSTQSVYTSPLGVSGEANTVRKTLLGQ